MRLGTIIRRWRKNEDLSVRDVAKMIGLDPATFVRFELGKGSPSAETLVQILNWILEKEKQVRKGASR